MIYFLELGEKIIPIIFSNNSDLGRQHVLVFFFRREWQVIEHMLKAPLLFGMDVKRRMEVSQNGGRWREAV
jgi:hypothetical protein